MPSAFRYLHFVRTCDHECTQLRYLLLLPQTLSQISHLLLSQENGQLQLKRWFRDLEDRVDDGEIIDDETMRKVIYHVNHWSGGDRLWQCMRDRVRESFSELVIVPALIDVFDRYNTLNEAINVESNIKKISKKEELEKNRQNISEGSERLIRNED